MKSIFALALLSLSFSSWACWHLKGSIEVNGKIQKIDQKINHDKTYSFQEGSLITHIKVPANFKLPKEVENKKDAQLIQIELVQKDGIKLKELSKAEVIVLGSNEAIMTKEDPKTKEYTKITLKLESI